MAAAVCAAFLADLDDAVEKEGEPAFPVPGIAHGLQAFVVFAAALLEVVREVEHRLGEHPLFGEQESDEEPPDAAVAIQKGMDGLELGMRQAHLQDRKSVV